MATKSAFIACLCAFWSAGASATHVPLLIWSSGRLPPASPPAGHVTSLSELRSYLDSALGSAPQTVLLFLQEKLSRDDFTVYGGVYGNKEDSAFKNVEAALRSRSAVFPAVEWSSSASVAGILEEKLGVAPLLVAPDTAADELKMDAAAADRLLLVRLPYCGREEPCRERLRSNDEVIGRVLKSLEAKNVPFTAFFTGLEPSRVISQPSASAHAGRSLLQAPTPAPALQPPIMFNISTGPCIMLWAQSLNVSFTSPETWTDLASQTLTTAGSTCNGTHSVLVLNNNNGITLSFSMSQRFFPVSARRWFSLDSVQLRQNAVSASFSSRSIYAPAEYSFHCQSVSSFRDALLVPGNRDNASAWMLNFVDFQIQGFGLNNDTNFSYASDCAGFFTPGIWMGLITSLLMLLILVYGLNMILQLNTMDRFDDPKGPCISVPQTE